MAFILFSGCETLGLGACEDNVEVGIQISLVDERTNQPVFAPTLAIAVPPYHSDTTSSVGESHTGLALIAVVQDVAGIYSLTIQTVGYDSWIRVEEDNPYPVRTYRADSSAGAAPVARLGSQSGTLKSTDG